MADDKTGGGPVTKVVGTGNYKGLSTSDAIPKRGAFGQTDKNGMTKKSSALPTADARKQKPGK